MIGTKLAKHFQPSQFRLTLYFCWSLGSRKITNNSFVVNLRKNQNMPAWKNSDIAGENREHELQEITTRRASTISTIVRNGVYNPRKCPYRLNG